MKIFSSNFFSNDFRLSDLDILIHYWNQIQIPDYNIFLECTPKAFWIALRHGFRNPGDDDIIEMQRRGEEIKEAILRNSYHNGKV